MIEMNHKEMAEFVAKSSYKIEAGQEFDVNDSKIAAYVIENLSFDNQFDSQAFWEAFLECIPKISEE